MLELSRTLWALPSTNASLCPMPLVHRDSEVSPASQSHRRAGSCRLNQSKIRTLQSQIQYLMYIPESFYRCYSCQQKEQLTAWWPGCSHDLRCSILSSTGSRARTIPRTGLKRMRRTLLLIIWIFKRIKIIVGACSACIHKWATKTVRREMLQTHVDIFQLRPWPPISAWHSYRRQTFIHNPLEMKWLSDGGGFVSSSLQETALSRKPLFSCHFSKATLRLIFKPGHHPLPHHGLLTSGPNSPFKSFNHRILCLMRWFLP